MTTIEPNKPPDWSGRPHLQRSYEFPALRINSYTLDDVVIEEVWLTLCKLFGRERDGLRTGGIEEDERVEAIEAIFNPAFCRVAVLRLLDSPSTSDDLQAAFVQETCQPCLVFLPRFRRTCCAESASYLPAAACRPC